MDAQGAVYVADWRNDRIQKFTPDGQFVARFGESGQGDGQFNRPSGVAVDAEGYIYVADWGNERVQVLGRWELPIAAARAGHPVEVGWRVLRLQPYEWQCEPSNLTPNLPPHLNTPYHISSQTEPYFWGPCRSRSTGRSLYVPETNRHRVQIYQKT